MLVRLTLSYRGESYAGWQRQTNALAVQQVVEEALSSLADEEVKVVASSRTDAGVHALGQVAHAQIQRRLPIEALVAGTNHYLPADVRVLEAQAAPPGFHARRDAIAKEYVYRLSCAAVISPLHSQFVVPAPRGLNVERLSKAAMLIEGRHDFTAFAKSGGHHSQPFRTVFWARFEERGSELRFVVIGNGFLRGMVRALVGTLLEVGTGQRPEESLEHLLSGRPRSEAGPNAAARGLVLERVIY